jgi:DNA-binding transcriptional ArsR family regulator
VDQPAAAEPEDGVSDLGQTLSALADPSRRAVVELLLRGPRRAGELAASLELTPPAMSRHLRVLRTAGLVAEDHQGDDARVRIYALKPEPFDEMRRWLDDVERFWTLELEAFRKHVEKTHGKSKGKGKR